MLRANRQPASTPSASVRPPPPPRLPACPQERLSLEGNALCTLPPALTALCALRHLDLTANQLAWLPPGPYLRRLEALLLSGNRLAQVPPVLAAAGACEVLDLSANPALELSRHDVDATLARMPRLALLLLGKGGMEGGLGLAPHPHGAAPAAAEWQWRTASVASLVALAQALPGLQIDFEHSEWGRWRRGACWGRSRGAVVMRGAKARLQGPPPPSPTRPPPCARPALRSRQGV